jgi:hypothetical protein
VLRNDPFSLQAITASIERISAIGATCNPAIVLAKLKTELQHFLWKIRLVVNSRI